MALIRFRTEAYSGQSEENIRKRIRAKNLVFDVVDLLSRYIDLLTRQLETTTKLFYFVTYYLDISTYYLDN